MIQCSPRNYDSIISLYLYKLGWQIASFRRDNTAYCAFLRNCGNCAFWQFQKVGLGAAAIASVTEGIRAIARFPAIAAIAS